MGGAKMLLPIAGKPMVAHAISAARAASLAGPIIVTQPHDTALQAVVSDAKGRCVLSDDYRQGMAHSLVAGLHSVPPDWRGAFIMLGDMPFVSPDLLELMATRLTGDAIVIPTFAGRRGNPVLWGREHFNALAALTGDVGGRVLWEGRHHNIVEEPWLDDTIFCDIDTPEDWATNGSRSSASPTV